MASKKRKSSTSETKPKKKKKYEVEVLNEFLTLPKRKRTSYASVNNYLNSVYRLNEDTIKEALSVKSTNMKTGEEIVEYPKNIKQSFKELVYGYMDEGLSPEASIKKLQNSTIFLPISEILKRNVIESLKSHKMYNTFRALNRNAEGKFMPFLRENLHWDKDQQLYYYNTAEYEVLVVDENGNLVKRNKSKVIIIEWKNSPEELLVYEK